MAVPASKIFSTAAQFETFRRAKSAPAAAQEAVGDLGHEPGDEPGVEEGDVGDPDHAKDERHHEEEEVGRSAKRPVRLQAGDVRDLYRRKLVLQDEMDVNWITEPYASGSVTLS